MKSVAPVTGATVTWAGPAIIVRLLISGTFPELLPVLKSIRIAARTLAVPPFSPVNVTETTPRSVPPSWEKFLMLRTSSSCTVIIRGEVVIILLFHGWANARLAATSITTAIKHRAAIFMLKTYTPIQAQPTAIGFTELPRHSIITYPASHRAI